MAALSPARAGFPLLQGLNLLSRGKVRDTYGLAGLPYTTLLSSATDGISIFDFVLNAQVSQKGVILNAINHFWDKLLRKFGIETHLLAAGVDIDDYLPPDLRGNIDLQSRAVVVRRLKMAPIEFIARAVLTGSAIKSYAQNGEVCGHKLMPGLQDGDELPFVMDTPTSKAEEGHDANLPADEIRQKYPQQTYQLIQIFQIASWYCQQKGIKLADTKFEFAEDGTLADELLTPDSSRFWEYISWLEGRKPETGRKAPPPYDKQFVRIWGIEQGINKLDPSNPADVAKAHSLVVPDSVLHQTTRIYRYIFWRLTGQTIEEYLRVKMSVNVALRKTPKIAIVCGSESDLPVVKTELAKFFGNVSEIAVHVMSCHRNSLALMKFAEQGCDGVDAVICVGSKALALPGVLDAFLYANMKDIPVIGVALGKSGSTQLLAAQLSIEELPGNPVIMDEISGQCYTGPEGLYQAIWRVVFGELSPQKPRTSKPVRMNVLG